MTEGHFLCFKFIFLQFGPYFMIHYYFFALIQGQSYDQRLNATIQDNFYTFRNNLKMTFKHSFWSFYINLSVFKNFFFLVIINLVQ